jgi:hypothetical protein
LYKNHKMHFLPLQCDTRLLILFRGISFMFGFHFDEFNEREFVGFRRICCWGNCRIKLPPRKCTKWKNCLKIWRWIAENFQDFPRVRFCEN